MTTTTGEQRRPVDGWFVSLRHSLAHTLDRPLTSYYLLLGASTLLLTIGLMEVISASSVDGFVHHGNSYYCSCASSPGCCSRCPSPSWRPGCRTASCGRSPGRRCSWRWSCWR